MADLRSIYRTLSSSSSPRPVVKAVPRRQEAGSDAVADMAKQSVYVEKPLEVKTNIVEHEGSVTFIEAQIENLMPLPIFLEHISLEPGPQLRTTDLNKRDTCLE
nr:unnamed protein product [Spirometra erinaceieuropaei]